jgi:hypothetical protein
MPRLVRLRSNCTHSETCPALHYQPDSGEFLVQGYEVVDVELLTELNLPAGEAVVRVAARLLPALRKEPQPC